MRTSRGTLSAPLIPNERDAAPADESAESGRPGTADPTARISAAASQRTTHPSPDSRAARSCSHLAGGPTGQRLLGVVQSDNLWVTANFKETQLKRMHPGESARVTVDAYGAGYDAQIENMPGASRPRFSLFPPENATGNYVKVVQRLPVRDRG